jgi:hypothetical protein
MAPVVPLLAHQYGWDEALLFVLPIVVVLVGVRWVERHNRQPSGDAADPARGDDPGAPGAPPPPETEAHP